MSAEEQAEPERLDAPNQQAVRPDSSTPWDEGEGGSTGAPKKASRSSKKSEPPPEAEPEEEAAG